MVAYILLLKKLLWEAINCIRLNNIHTYWFKSSFGVRQTDKLSPTLFSVYLNDLAVAINAAKLVIRFKNNEFVNNYTFICRQHYSVRRK